jgi:hypothetical protein
MDSGMIRVFIIVFGASMVVRFMLAKYPTTVMGVF